MRIDHLVIENFKGFSKREFSFASGFNLIVGTNGTGKTSTLEALAVATGSWFLGLRGYDSRHMLPNEVRLEPRNFDGEIRFEAQYPAKVTAAGSVMDEMLMWERSVDTPNGKTRFMHAANVKALAANADAHVRSGEGITLPLISYYGTGRLWQEPRATSQVKKPDKLVGKKELSRLEGYKNSVDPRLSTRDLVIWIARQSWIGYQQGKEPPVFQAVKQAIIGCVEDAENLYFDPKRGEVIVVMRDHGAQPFFNLSDGQRCMLAMVGDIAQKAAKLNPQFGANVLLETPGVVLIDELDLHLHPRWQRRVISDLRRTFPKIQFICTTHSPQLIGQAKSGEIILLDELQEEHPGQSFGMDSNWVLRHIMGSDDRDPQVAARLDEIFEDIEESRFEEAGVKVSELRKEIGEHPDLVEAEALISRYARPLES
ncbi:MAG: AAA family ATPase [Phreatobacter sp.]|nr:AAA family ATPase [Phreatobacter sp.]